MVLKNPFDGTVSCNRVNDVSVSATLPSYHLCQYYVTSVSRSDCSVTHVFTSRNKFDHTTLL